MKEMKALEDLKVIANLLNQLKLSGAEHDTLREMVKGIEEALKEKNDNREE